MGRFLETNKLSWQTRSELTQNQKENLNSAKTSKEIELVMECTLINKSPGSDGFFHEFYKIFIFLVLYLKEEGIVPDSLYKIIIS